MFEWVSVEILLLLSLEGTRKTHMSPYLVTLNTHIHLHTIGNLSGAVRVPRAERHSES